MLTFTQIADSGSLTAAAQAMESSLPAVVRSLGALEAELGVRLFNRSTRRISLTEEGRRYLESCRQILGAVADAEAGLSSQVQEPSGLLTITASVAIGQMVVTPVIMSLVKRYPKVRCNLVLLDRVVNLLEEGIDIGVRVGELQDSTLIAQKIGAVRRVLVASPRYLEQHGRPSHPKDLLKINCIRFSTTNGPWWRFQENGKEFTLAVTGNLEFNHAGSALAACVEGLGIGVFTSYQVAPSLATGQLQILLEAFESPPRPINLIYPHARLLPSRTKIFIEMMKQGSKALQE
ncbi:LysR family transcriptional regulator [Sulfurirhabdus autotrophica]|nr:LysR family transcriptional regulator [Sulfurirhabdus autotrophica]